MSVATTEIKARTDVKPSAKQVYAIAHLTIDALGLKWPESRADASQLITQLREVKAPESAGGDIPI